MKRLSMLVVIVMGILAITPTFAQEPPELKCSTAATQEIIDSVIGTLSDVPADDVQAHYIAVQEAQAQLARIDSLCLGLDFKGTANIVSDPVYVPAGLYRVTATSADSFFLYMTPLEGECGPRYGEALFSVSGEGAANGAQALLFSEGCLAIWETNYINAPYTVTFERLADEVSSDE